MIAQLNQVGLLTNIVTYEWIHLFIFHVQNFPLKSLIPLKMHDYQSKKSPEHTYIFKR